MKKPLISIITVCYNSWYTIERAINSVITQNCANYEYIVIDGGSTDGTIDILDKYNNSINYWDSRPDGGIYHAMNKGIHVAQGEWIFFLGSDDTLMPNILARIEDLLLNSCDIVYGNIVLSNGKIFISNMGYKMLLGNTLHHQSAFYNRRLFCDFQYDNNFKIMADYELNLIAYLSNLKTLHINEVISTVSLGGVSSRFWPPLYEILKIHDKLVKNNIIKFTLKVLIKLRFYLAFCKLIIGNILFKVKLPVDVIR